MQLQRERAEMDCLESGQPQDNPLRDPDDSDEEEEDEGEEERLFYVQCDCRMATILQEALYKCDQVTSLMNERWDFV